ncbi:RING finger protein 17 [Microtus ochrogaster]|uniref:RING finger protein 17 n=1 Tax=Microtus ochrogaster TaxID=79684 RepID=A0A8J6GVG5_MICOH|nr:RING finger protein 17 [Microtus ochrogaster]
MTATYENSEWKPVRWERDMHCAVKVPAKSQWRRGQIIRMVTDTLVEAGFSVALEPVLELALVDQAGLELTEIRLPLPPKGGRIKESELIKMMDEIQSNFKCLGLLEPYFWKKGEPCAVRGSDTLWYRGKVVEVVGGTIRVQYLDHGFTEKIPQCHLYPIVLYPDTPQFCIPCQLYQTLPVGNVWQPDAIELLQELLPKREVDIHIMELLLPEMEAPILPPYLSSLLPPPEERYAVQVKHIVSPNEVYICLDSAESCSHHPGDTDDSGISWESESENLEEALQRYNRDVENFPPLTDFSSEMPCLAEYADGLWYRAKIISIKEFNPLSVLVLFVDYGSTEKLTVNR